MSNALRKFRKRQRKPQYICCKHKMAYKESHGVYICEICGREKKAKEEGGIE